MGVSHLLELDGPSCLVLGEVLSIDMLPTALAKDAAFLAVGTIWMLAWERWLQMAVLPLGMPWQVEQMEVTKVITPTRHGKR